MIVDLSENVRSFVLPKAIESSRPKFERDSRLPLLRLLLDDDMILFTERVDWSLHMQTVLGSFAGSSNRD